MTIRNLDRLLAPRSVALIGAGERPGSVGQTMVRNMLASAYRGDVMLLNPMHATGLNARFAHLAPPKGRIAFLAQSGAIVTSVIDWAAARGIGFSCLVSMGDMADVDFADMLDYLAADEATTAVLLYVETVG